VKRRAFLAAVILSLVLAAWLMCGYLVRMRTTIGHLTVDRAGFRGRFVTVGVGGGHMVFLYELGAGSALASPLHAGWNMSWQGSVLPIRAPSLRRSTWDFDAYWVPAPSVPSAYRSLIVACPLWCVIVPSLVAPAIWLRRRMQTRRQMRGFPVESVTGVIG
jgi:hypothetical protein